MATEYMNGETFIGTISSVSQGVSGLTPATAAAGLGGAVYATNGGAGLYSFPMQNITGGSVLSDATAYAADLWNHYKETVVAGVSSIGAAAAASTSWAQGVLFGNPELAGTLAGSGGLLTMSLPVAATVMAPLLGVSIGGSIYALAPDICREISETLMPWAYDDKEVLPFVVDKLGQVYAPQGAVQALGQYFREKHIGEAASYETQYQGITVHWANAIGFSVHELTGHYTDTFLSGGTDLRIVQYTNSQCVLFSRTRTGNNGIVFSRYIPSTGQTVTQWTDAQNPCGHGYYAGPIMSGITGLPVSTTTSRNVLANAIYEGQSVPVGGYPEGLSQWGGNQVDVSQLTPIQVVSGLNGSTTPYIPITLPVGDPTVTNDPLIQPSPIAPVEPYQLDPYISPVTTLDSWPSFSEEIPVIEPEAKVGPQVGDDPMYVPVPSLNPALNPSIPVAVPTDELTTNQQNAESGGVSPSPLFPVPDVPFPSWMPAGSETPVPSGQPGFIQVYHPQPGKFIDFGRWLWVTYADATIDKIWNNPFDGVIGAHELYATPADDGYSTIRCGFLDSGIETQVVRQRYTQINCGSMVIPEYWGNYLDYSPYSQAMLYLPFIGIVPLEVDDIVGHAVNVLYHVDSYTGSCIAQVTVARENYSNTLYQFSGNCSVEIPLAGASQAQIKAALMTANAYQNAANVSATMSTIGGIGSGLSSIINGFGGGAFSNTPAGMAIGAISGFAGAAGSVINGLAGAETQRAYGAAQHTANMLSGKSIVQHSGSFGSSHGAMGIKKPYIIIRRPIQKVVNGYEKLYGYPAHKQVIIGACTGFLRCREVHVLSSLATDAEKAKIESLLTSGVYVTEE